MKGFFNKRPPLPRYNFTWPVTKVLDYLKTLFPLCNLSLKMLTFKLVALLALSTASRAQTLVSLNIDCMRIFEDKVSFVFHDLLKTSRPRQTFQLNVFHSDDEKLCVMHTLLHYLDRTSNVRKSQYVLVSYCTFSKVTSSTVARWLKDVLSLAGIDVSIFKAHSYRGAAASAAFVRGCSLKEILKAADWSSVKNFRKFYLRDLFSAETSSSGISFANAVFE